MTGKNIYKDVLLGSLSKILGEKDLFNDEKKLAEVIAKKNIPYEMVKLIVAQLPFLNENVDHEYFQKKVNSLDKEYWEKIEANLANEIIDEF